MKIFISQINPFVGNIIGNTKKILKEIKKAKEEKIDIVVFPELAICGYPPEDLLFFHSFLDAQEDALAEITQQSNEIMVVVGLARRNPTESGKPLFNSAAVIINGKLMGFKDKTLLPTYDVFNESRYFEPGDEQKVFEYKGKKIGIMICEDVWQHSKVVVYTRYMRDPVEEIRPLNPDFIILIAASPYYFQKKESRNHVYAIAASSLHCPMVVCNQIGANDQLVFDGFSGFFNEKGELIQQAKGFEEDHLIVDLDHPSPACHSVTKPTQDLYDALVLGVKDYFRKQGFKKAIIGISGGIDSSLTTCIAVKALGKENILCLSMPSRFSSLMSLEFATVLTERLQVEKKDIPIDTIYQKFLDLLSPIFSDKPFGTAEENLQARIRGMVLMAVSNKLGCVVLSTGNKSEMATGYTTLYGDMAGGLDVLGDVSKTLVYELAHWVNREEEIIPKGIIARAPSAELKPNQTDQELLPPYAIVDTVLEEYVEEHLSPEEIIKKHQIEKDTVLDLIRMIHRAEFKRRQGPIAIRVTKTSFSKGRVLPIVQGWIR